MYCKNCGAKLELENQRFCQNCGSEIKTAIKTTQTRSKIEEYKTTPTSPSFPEYHTLKKEGGSGPYSKRCLGFGIVSLIIALTTFDIGTTILTELFYYIIMRRVFIGLTVAHVVGLIFGIISRVSGGKAKVLEPESSILKAGNVLGVIGIVFNSILMIIAIVMSVIYI
ncbi:MAG: zinc-ribbon domain-containing protein [Promethearchaeota archaeon]